MAGKVKGGDGSVVDGLKDIYTQVATLKLAPDAAQYAEILDKLTQALLSIIQQVTQQKAQQAAQMQAQVRQQAVNPMMGGPQQQSGITAGRPSPGMPGGPPSQGSPGMAMPDPDEMRRMLQTQGQGG